jgi:hypothetical protein
VPLDIAINIEDCSASRGEGDLTVIPAKAGIHAMAGEIGLADAWMPRSSRGMTRLFGLE